MSPSARFGIDKQRSASLLIFPAAYASVQNLVASVILHGSVGLANHFVVLFPAL